MSCETETPSPIIGNECSLAQVSQTSQPESVSSYELPETTTPVDMSQLHDSYEALNNDVWEDIFPVIDRPHLVMQDTTENQAVSIAVQILGRPSDASQALLQSDQINRSVELEMNEISHSTHVLFNTNEIRTNSGLEPENHNDRESLIIPSAADRIPSRPLPRTPLDTYATYATPLGTYAQPRNSRDNNILSNIKKNISVTKLTFLVIALVSVVIVAAVITATMLNVESNKNIANETMTIDEHQNGSSMTPFFRKPTLIGRIHVKVIVSGITVLGSQLFVAQHQSPHVDIYNTNNFSPNGTITITGAANLQSVIASSQSNCLYFIDFPQFAVGQYNLSNNNITNWPVGGESFPNGLSLSKLTGNVLVTLWKEKQIREFTPQGVQIRVINPTSCNEELSHVVQLSNGRYVVSHGVRLQNGPIHRVCIVDVNGRIFEQYGGLPGSGIGQLSKPTGLAVDSHDNVLVADYNNNRVVLLSSSLTHLGYITIPGHEKIPPMFLHFDELNRRLYIADLGDGFKNASGWIVDTGVFILNV